MLLFDTRRSTAGDDRIATYQPQQLFARLCRVKPAVSTSWLSTVLM